jgi:protein SCO1/2
MRRRTILSAAMPALLMSRAALAAPQPGPATMQLGGQIALIDQAGRPFSSRQLFGKPTVLYFGYTFCPEICPTTLASMTLWMKMLGRDAGRANFAFVTIDPERDHPEALKRFLHDFDPRIIGLTGSPAAIGEITRSFGVYAKKVVFESGDYAMDHSTSAYLLDKTGRFVEAFKYNVSAHQAVAQIRYMVNVYG